MRRELPSSDAANTVRPSGLMARSSATPTPRMTPIAAGLLSSAASRLPRVCAVSLQGDAFAREQQ